MCLHSALQADDDELHAVSEIMNISIEWPRGRGYSSQPFDDTCESISDDNNTDTAPHDTDSVYLTPFDLARSRRGDWPTVDPAIEICELLSIYQQVRDSGLPNMLGLRIPVPSLLKVSAWQAVATGHPDDNYVLDGIVWLPPPLHRPGAA